jgi:hypothetical protein
MTVALEHPGGAAPASTESSVPTRRSALLFRAKSAAHQGVRGVRNAVSGPTRLRQNDDGGYSVIIGESRSALWSDERLAECHYQRGKVENLRQAVRQLDRVVIPGGRTFSFWRQIGRATRRRGFVPGRMLKEGCLVPAVGGGLCQLSNALYDAALQANCVIVERHAHSRAVAGSAATLGRDATVAWNYVDLRFRARQELQIEARVERDMLLVRFRARSGSAVEPITAPPAATASVGRLALAQSCATCGQSMCFRHELRSAPVKGRVAYLVDENWPEFQQYVAQTRASNDVMGLPLDGARWRLPRYRWDTTGFARIRTASWQALSRALAMRRLPTQGAARRRAELRAAERIARRLARLLTADVTHVCIAQSLLPFLWRDGHLGGREVSVLMSRLPISELEARLDAAAEAHPERATLNDFRAPSWLVAAETDALSYVERIITPHAQVAQLFANKAVVLDWHRPSCPAGRDTEQRARIAFPGPAIARAGAYEVRDAARALGLELLRFGSELEGADFWDGIIVARSDLGAVTAAWLKGVVAVVQPAVVASRPQDLLIALAAGTPVIATAACGLPPQDGLTLIPTNDPEALIAALKTVLATV